MSTIVAVDPGTTHSAYCVFEDLKLVEFGKLENEDLLRKLRLNFVRDEQLVVEMVESFGMAVGKEVFQTVFWVGRFVEAFPHPWHLIYRSKVKLHLCRSVRAKDANIRCVLIDRFGGQEKAIGRKKAKGPLYGVSGDCWSAIAIAITHMETRDITPELTVPMNSSAP